MGKGGSVLRELKPVLRRIGLYYLLLAVNIFPCASLIPDRFPTRNLSTIYLLLLSVCLVLYYAHRVPPRNSFAPTMQLLSWMGLLLILLRGVKYSAFAEVGVLARHTWYLYYVPMLLLPLFLFRIALLVTPKERGWEARAWYPALGLTLALILLVLSNDLHQQVFAFRPDFFDWDRSHSHGWLFYVVTLWQYALYLAAVLILVSKCRIGGSRRSARILLIPFAVGAALNVLLFTGTMPKLNGSHLVEFPEALICSAATVLECCMQLGLIPTNQDYGKLFHLLSISAQITDSRGRTVYASRTALPLTREQFAMEDNTRIGEHKVLRRMPLPGGFGFWQDDLTELDRLNEALAEAKDALTQESELIRLRGALKERQAKIEQRTRVYDAIAKRTRRQAQSISRLAGTARASSDPMVKEECRKRITLLGAYIKRYANLTLLAQEKRCIETGELALSFSEVLRYLSFCGIPGELVHSADATVPVAAALAVFEAFGALLETNVPGLRGLLVNLSAGECVRVKLSLEGLSAPLPDSALRQLAAAGVLCDLQWEDGVGYLSLRLPKGGAAP